MKKIIKYSLLISSLFLIASCGNTNSSESTSSSESSSEYSHQHTYVEHSSKEASCLDKGNKLYYTCEDCELIFDENKQEIDSIEIIDSLSHNWELKETIKKPTCTEKGEGIYNCTRCDTTINRNIASLGHDCDYTYSKDGWHVGTCKVETCLEVVEGKCNRLGDNNSCSLCEQKFTVHECSYGEPVWEYVEKDNEFKAYLVARCSQGDNKIQTEGMLVQTEKTDSTCDSDGTVKYLVSANYNNKEYSESHTFTLKAGHKYNYTYLDESKHIGKCVNKDSEKEQENHTFGKNNYCICGGCNLKTTELDFTKLPTAVYDNGDPKAGTMINTQKGLDDAGLGIFSYISNSIVQEDTHSFRISKDALSFTVKNNSKLKITLHGYVYIDVEKIHFGLKNQNGEFLTASTLYGEKVSLEIDTTEEDYGKYIVLTNPKEHSSDIYAITHTLVYDLVPGTYILSGSANERARTVINGFVLEENTIYHAHDFVYHEELVGTCDLPGRDAYYTCKNCLEVFDKDLNSIEDIPSNRETGHTDMTLHYDNEEYHSGVCEICTTPFTVHHYFDASGNCACGARNAKVYTMDLSNVASGTNLSNANVTQDVLDNIGLSILNASSATGTRQLVTSALRITAKGFTFTVDGPTTVTITLNTWNNNPTSFAIKDEKTGNLVNANENKDLYNSIQGEYAVNGELTLTYNLEAGTYRFFNTALVQETSSGTPVFNEDGSPKMTTCRVGITALEIRIDGVYHNHTYSELTPEVEATCTSDGLEGYYTCLGCDDKFNTNKKVVESIPVITSQGHKLETYEKFDESQHKSKCGTCGEYIYENHKESEVIIENKVEGDCYNATTYDEVIKCITCNAELSRENITSSFGHISDVAKYENVSQHSGNCTTCLNDFVQSHSFNESGDCICGARNVVVYAMDLSKVASGTNLTNSGITQDVLDNIGLSILDASSATGTRQLVPSQLRITTKGFTFTVDGPTTVTITLDRWSNTNSSFAIKDEKTGNLVNANEKATLYENITGEYAVTGSVTLTYTLEAGTYRLYNSCEVRVGITALEIRIHGVYHNHKQYTEHAATEANCTEEGNELYYTCNGCSSVFNSNKEEIDEIPVIKELGHNCETATYVDKTYHSGTCTRCTENGNLEHVFDTNGDCICGARNVVVYVMDLSSLPTGTNIDTSDEWKDYDFANIGLSILDASSAKSTKQLVTSALRFAGEGFTFTVDGPATVTITLDRWNNKNSSFAIKDEKTGNLVNANENADLYNSIQGEYAVTGSVTLTYTLEAGTYRLYNSITEYNAQTQKNDPVRVGITALEIKVGGVYYTKEVNE